MVQFFVGVLVGVVGLGITMLLQTEKSGMRDADAIQAAQDMEIGKGVTLSQGLKALYGGETFWAVPEGDWVRVMAGMNLPAASLYVYPKTGEIKIFSPDYEGVANEQQQSLLLGMMVEKARARKTDS